MVRLMLESTQVARWSVIGQLAVAAKKSSGIGDHGGRTERGGQGGGNLVAAVLIAENPMGVVVFLELFDHFIGAEKRHA